MPNNVSEAPVVVPYKTDWTFVAMFVAPFVLLGLFVVGAALR